MKIHELKIQERFYQRVVDGHKKAEVRKNDRDFQEGDIITFVVLDESGETYYPGCGRPEFVITHILHGGEWGIEHGYCVMSIEEIKKT